MTGALNRPDSNRRHIGPNTIAQTIEAFIKCKGISARARLLGCELVSRFNQQTGQCFPSDEYLARALDCSKRQVTREKNRLKEAGLIDWTRGHRGQSSSYTIPWGTLREQLHTFRESEKTRRDGLVIDEKKRQDGADNETNVAHLLSQENTKQDARAGASAQPDDDPRQLPDLTGCNGYENEGGELMDHGLSIDELDRATECVLTYISPKLLDGLPKSTFDEAVAVCARNGLGSVRRFISTQRRQLGLLR